MKNKTLGNKLFKSGKVLIAVAGVSVIMTNAVIPVISTVSANTNKVTPVHTASNWRANDQKTVDNTMRSQGIDSINDLSNYNVVWGDTLTTIANHFHTTADELKNKFNIVNADFIVAGFELSNQSQFNSIGRELLSSSITSFNKNTTAAYLQKPTNVDRRSNSNNSTSNTEQKQVVAVNHDYSVTANNNVTDKAAADKAAADKAAADKAAAEKAAADQAAAEKAAADKAAADESSVPLNMHLSAVGTDTVGKYAKSLYVYTSGFDGRPMTVTGIKVSDGNGLTTSYTEEQLQRMGFNVNLTAGNGFNAHLPSQVGTQGWDTSNLTVNADVKLENGQTTTLTDKIYPSPSN